MQGFTRFCSECIHLAGRIAVLLPPFIWPSFWIAVVLFFSTELRGILKAVPNAFERMTSADLFGVKLTLRDLEKSNSQAETDIKRPTPAPLQPPVPSSAVVELQAAGESLPDQTNAIEPISSASPARSFEWTLPSIATAIDRYLQRLSASFGLLDKYTDPRQIARFMNTQNLLPLSVQNSVDAFFALRSRMMAAPVPLDVLSDVISAGSKLLTTLQEVPRNDHLVVAIDVPLYSDQNATKEMQNVKGVILKDVDQHGKMSDLERIFPTRTPMPLNKFVSWEWKTGISWGRTWYKSRPSGEVVIAWVSSSEFTGRDLDEICPWRH